ncbi:MULTISPECIES: TolC family protein [Roseateles]|uniref:TolC family protein n=1 Tax=Pelomonas caseinilytica TaxID=2906763 RepID=A0ABS8XN90_9BURK|nr:TolC family protein [Roseateles sp.]MCE4540133.1 TolC family protein [Pelomonas sp. P7]HEV6968359.1 TolC family protein [Roseateles sp.]
MLIRLLPLLLFALPAAAQTLPELAARALDADPAVRASDASLRAAEQRLFQARAAYGPTANFTATASNNHYREAPAYEPRPFKSEQYVVQVNQPLWRGALYPALQAANSQLEQAESALQQARLEAQQRLAEAVLEVFKARDVLAHATALREAYAEQLAAARRSFQVGRAAAPEVREAEARVDSGLAQVLAAEADLDMRRQVLAEVAAGPTPTLLTRAVAPEALPPLQADGVLDWLARAEVDSPQLRQARLALEAAEAEIRKASLAHAPTVDLNASYTRSNDTGTVTSIFPRRGNTTAVGATLTIPLFASGATQSKVVETMALRDKAAGELDLARRTLVIGVRQAFVATLSALSQARALATAERSQALSVRANQRGYEVGIKTNADVLEAQGKLFEARRDLSRARHDAWASYFKLRALAGQLNEADWQALDAQLVEHRPDEIGRARARSAS